MYKSVAPNYRYHVAIQIRPKLDTVDGQGLREVTQIRLLSFF